MPNQQPPFIREPQSSRPHAPRYAIPTNDESLLPWSHASERLERATIYWLATTCPDGRPHVAPVWGAWIDNAFYFDGIPTSRWARNLVVNPALSVHLESGKDVVIVEGIAEDTNTDAALAARIADVYISKYELLPNAQLVPKADTSGIFCLRPQRAFAWTRFPHDATRWRFE